MRQRKDGRERRKEILRILRRELRMYGCSPTQGEIAKELKLHPQGVWSHIQLLTGLGMLCRAPGRRRNALQLTRRGLLEVGIAENDVDGEMEDLDNKAETFAAFKGPYFKRRSPNTRDLVLLCYVADTPETDRTGPSAAACLGILPGTVWRRLWDLCRMNLVVVREDRMLGKRQQTMLQSLDVTDLGREYLEGKA